MVRDIKVYMDIFQGEPDFRVVDIEGVVASALEKVKTGACIHTSPFTSRCKSRRVM